MAIRPTPLRLPSHTITTRLVFTARLLLMSLLALAMSPATSFAQSGATDLARASISELMNLEITSASRKSERISDVPGALFVLSQDDIRRSGITTLPELFRLVPGMNVARISSSEWAVSVRGLNNLNFDKLLVLLDGSTLYSHGSVTWSLEDMMVDDIDRIEVLRGPAGAVWGSNAVNGFVNIITKSSALTQGLLVHTGSGTFDGQTVAARFGGALGGATYRLDTHLFGHDTSLATPDARASDTWRSWSGGGRVDWVDGADAYMVQGRSSNARTRPPVPHVTSGSTLTDLDLGTALGRWTHTFGDGDTLEVQASARIAQTLDLGEARRDTQRAADVDVVYVGQMTARHALVAGGGYRRNIHDFNTEPAGKAILPYHWNTGLANLFAQDQIGLTESVTLTLGSRVEHDSFTGWNVQPTTRVLWQIPNSEQRLWASVSRAAKPPTTTNLGFYLRVPLPPSPNSPRLVLEIAGNPEYRNEWLTAVEAGYGLGLGSRATIQIVGFDGRYTGLPSTRKLASRFEASPAPPHILLPQVFSNGLSASTRGGEIEGRWRPFAKVDLAAFYSYLHVVGRVDPADESSTALTMSPAHQWHVRASTTLSTHVEVSGLVSRVGRIASPVVPAYTRADLRLEIKATRTLTVVAAGQNLLSASHVEAGEDVIVTPTLVPRSASINLIWRMAR
jgi:iron complex outermembrane receptor protein